MKIKQDASKTWWGILLQSKIASFNSVINMGKLITTLMKPIYLLAILCADIWKQLKSQRLLLLCVLSGLLLGSRVFQLKFLKSISEKLGGNEKKFFFTKIDISLILFRIYLSLFLSKVAVNSQ